MEVYQPSEDSYLFKETLEKYLVHLKLNMINKTNINKIKQDSKNKINNIKNINAKQGQRNKTSKVNQQLSLLKPKKINSNNIYKNIKILDMGSGSGILAETCKRLGFENILTVDINPDTVKYLKSKGFDIIQSDLFNNLKSYLKFDLIVFNPPYLPNNRFDKNLDTTGGKEGYELIIKFLKQAKMHLNKKGIILLLYSSLSKPNIILKTIKELGFKKKLLSKKKLFFEELYVYEITI